MNESVVTVNLANNECNGWRKMYEGSGMELKHIPTKHPAFYLKADPDPKSQTNADPGGSGSTTLQPSK